MGASAGNAMWAAYGAWGLFGVLAIEGMEFSNVTRAAGAWPWRVKGEDPMALLASVVIRLVIGGGLAIAAGLSHQVSNPFGAIAVGASAPMLIEQLARRVPLAPDVAPAHEPPSVGSSATESQGGSDPS